MRLKIIIALSILVLVFLLQVITSKADGRVEFSNEYSDVVYYAHPESTPTPTPSTTPISFVVGTRGPVLCTTDCSIQSVEVCTRDLQHCTHVDAMFCTQKVGDSCEQVFSSFVN